MPHPDRRVVITGMGLISPLGNSLSELAEALKTGTSGVDLLTQIPSDNFPSDIGGECRKFTGDVNEFGETDKMLKRSIKKSLRMMCREIQMGVAAAQLCLANAGIAPGSYEPTRIGTMFGSDYIVTAPGEFRIGIENCLDSDGKFEFERWAEDGLTKVEPTWLLKYLPNMPASHVAILNDLQGPSNSLTVREASSNLSVAEAVNIIRRGNADAMVVGATGSRIHPLRTVHFTLQETLANRQATPANGDPTKASRPFERDRTGMVLGEGAGAVILEERETAIARGANILAEVTGYGSSSVISRDGVPNFRTATENVIYAALETSGIAAAKVGHVHAHGTSSISVDEQEAVAIETTLGNVPVTSAKSYMGNLGAGSGMVEIIASVLAMREGKLFPVLNFDTPDKRCPINVVTEATETGDCFLNLNVTMQGQASSVLISRDRD